MTKSLLIILLVTRSAVAQYYDDKGASLLRAAYGGNREIVAQLIENGLDVNAHDPYGVTPLYLAVENGQMETVKLLLVHGANVNVIPKPNVPAGRPSMTPLMVAAQRGHAEIVKLLIKHGADISAEVGETAMYPAGATALLLAAINGHTDVINILNEAGTAGEWMWKYMVIAIWIFFGSFLISLWDGQDDNRGMKNP
jgi:ankyrin repeat protein